jgi:hypothetical protein
LATRYYLTWAAAASWTGSERHYTQNNQHLYIYLRIRHSITETFSLGLVITRLCRSLQYACGGHAGVDG